MRWKKTPIGSVRLVRRFLLWPTTIDLETRWLEWAWIKQGYVEEMCFPGFRYMTWADCAWSNGDAAATAEELAT